MSVVFPSFLRDIYLRLGSLLLVIGYALQWWNFDKCILGLGLIYLIAFVMLFTQLVVVNKLRFDFSFKFFGGRLRKRLFSFAAYSMLMASSFALINNVTYDQVTTQLGPALNGIYTTCFFIALIVEMPKRNMIKVLGPVISLEFERNNIQEVGQTPMK